MRLAIYCDGNFIVTIPYRLEENLAEKFIRQKANWVLEKLEHFKKIKISYFSTVSKYDYFRYKEKAFNLAKARVEYFNKIYNFRFNKITIKRQKTRWGSCSKKGNLNFNYKIALLPEKIADYIIVHELCHLKEFNHSKNFWNLVEKTIPGYSAIIKELKQ